MNTNYKTQIEAIQKARTAIENLIERNGERVRLTSSVDECKEIIAALNDAGSTIAALNLNPYLKDLETFIANQKFREELLHKKIAELEKHLAHYADVNQNQ